MGYQKCIVINSAIDIKMLYQIEVKAFTIANQTYGSDTCSA